MVSPLELGGLPPLSNGPGPSGAEEGCACLLLDVKLCYCSAALDCHSMGIANEETVLKDLLLHRMN